jgi:hypothetical protein
MTEDLMKDERSLGDLFSELANETGTLVRQEVALAQAEMVRKATKAGKQVGYVAVGGAVGYAALLAVMAAVITILAYIIPLWLSCVLVGAVVGGVSYYMVTTALENLKQAQLAPTETVESIKEDAKWLKHQVS